MFILSKVSNKIHEKKNPSEYANNKLYLFDDYHKGCSSGTLGLIKNNIKCGFNLQAVYKEVEHNRPIPLGKSCQRLVAQDCILQQISLLKIPHDPHRNCNTIIVQLF